MFSKVCTFLKSRCDSVRETSRDTLIRMMTALGPQHLRTLLEAAESVLQRGFQVHVYIFTVHAILVKLTESDQLKAGTLDPVVQHIVEVTDALFNNASNERWTNFHSVIDLQERTAGRNGR